MRLRLNIALITISISFSAIVHGQARIPEAISRLRTISQILMSEPNYLLLLHTPSDLMLSYADESAACLLPSGSTVQITAPIEWTGYTTDVSTYSTPHPGNGVCGNKMKMAISINDLAEMYIFTNCTRPNCESDKEYSTSLSVISYQDLRAEMNNKFNRSKSLANEIEIINNVAGVSNETPFNGYLEMFSKGIWIASLDKILHGLGHINYEIDQEFKAGAKKIGFYKDDVAYEATVRRMSPVDRDATYAQCQEELENLKRDLIVISAELRTRPEIRINRYEK